MRGRNIYHDGSEQVEVIYSREKEWKKVFRPIKKMYQLFVEKCKNENQETCKSWMYCHIFNTRFNGTKNNQC